MKCCGFIHRLTLGTAMKCATAQNMLCRFWHKTACGIKAITGNPRKPSIGLITKLFLFPNITTAWCCPLAHFSAYSFKQVTPSVGLHHSRVYTITQEFFRLIFFSIFNFKRTALVK